MIHNLAPYVDMNISIYLLYSIFANISHLNLHTVPSRVAVCYIVLIYKVIKISTHKSGTHKKTENRKKDGIIQTRGHMAKFLQQDRHAEASKEQGGTLLLLYLPH